ncbi:MAG: UDP-3-O-[3-hydroxymyristoyl] N-acetylglucosamine deacetylase [Cyclobacteriaceae bacterium]
MKFNQHTIETTSTVSGIGLHTGVMSKMIFTPAPINHGIKFQRTDLDGGPTISADIDNVVDTSRGTTIEQHGAKVYTVEHTLAALVGLEIDNVLIKINGPEPPIMDGSARLLMDQLLKAGLFEQNAPRKFIEVPVPFSYRDASNQTLINISPSTDYSLNVSIDYNSETLGIQEAELNQISNFYESISNARTFCFLHEIEMLFKTGLIKGGDLSNAVVIVDREIEDREMDQLANLLGKEKITVKKSGVLNDTSFRFENEAARHKLLDLVGDLALLGGPLRGHISANRPGHTSNVQFARELKAYLKNLEGSVKPDVNAKVGI